MRTNTIEISIRGDDDEPYRELEVTFRGVPEGESLDVLETAAHMIRAGVSHDSERAHARAAGSRPKPTA